MHSAKSRCVTSGFMLLSSSVMLRPVKATGLILSNQKPPHSTVTLFAKFLGLSTSVPLAQAV
ncbi:hypothetical protein SBC1_34360 [Caballeronia sp. SBC1]|nr:hypothetical protein SBC1_34360 [Caballeronia sp. SBC1]